MLMGVVLAMGARGCIVAHGAAGVETMPFAMTDADA
jgi:hypothetical protein